jgi:L-alanine-DL-glutamate epimerase-like enolase superfamily enzyme
MPPDAAEQWIEVLAEFDPLWLEEPFPAHEHERLAQLRTGAPYPIAAGESETEANELEQLLAGDAVDVMQPDAYRVGLSAMREICARAISRGVVAAPHMAHEVSAHVTSLDGDGCWLEYFDWFDEWWKEPVVPNRGRLTPSTRPGHGLELKDGWLESHRL